MKDFFKLFFKYLPRYKKHLILNFITNVLGAVFGAFSFALFIPVLGILFETQDMVLEVEPFQFSATSLTEHFYYYISTIIVEHGKNTALVFISIILVITVLLKVGFTYLGEYVLIFIRNGIVRDIRTLMNNKILSLSILFFSDKRKGDIIARISGDVSEIEDSIMNSINALFKNPIIILISLIVMLYMSWTLTLFVFVLLPISGYIIGQIGKSLKKSSLKIRYKIGELISAIEETLTGLKIIKAFNAEQKIKSKFNNVNEDYRNLNTFFMRKYSLASPMSEFLGTTVIVIILLYGGNLVLTNESELSAQGFIGYLVFFYSIINPAKSFSSAIYSIRKGMAASERVDEILQVPHHIEEKKNPEILKKFNREIEYKNIYFKYIPEDDQHVLKKINLTIRKGNKIALVGQSGAGKSTMVDLLPRFFDGTKGEICIDGINIKDISLKNLRSLIGYVNQEPILFNDSFFNNITLGMDNISLDKVMDAAKIANAHKFIEKTKNGYNTNIGDKGNKLSGGQRQRISIARAILKNPPILILDEATSSLDTESEKLVQEAIENLMKKRTSIVIAHRLSTVRNADEIVVMQQGEIVERGTHEELFAKKGIYFKFNDIQGR